MASPYIARQCCTQYDFFQHLRSGSTAAVAVIVEQTLHVAWLGDSQVLLVKNGQPVTVCSAACIACFLSIRIAPQYFVERLVLYMITTHAKLCMRL